MSTSINVDSDAMKSIVADAILKTLPEDKKELLILEAINLLITPAKDSYNRSIPPQSPLEKAFGEAVVKYANEMIAEEMRTNTTLTVKLKELVANAFDKAFEDQLNPEKHRPLVQAIERSLSSYLSGHLKEDY